MPRFVCFLRGINVGGHRVTMDELRRHFVALKFGRIETFIASGNVLFDAATDDVAALESNIEQHLSRALGYEVPAFLRTPAEVTAVAEHQPFAPADRANETYSCYVLFLRKPLAAAAARDLAGLSCATDEFRAHGREIYWLCRGKISDPTPAAKAFEKLLRAARAEATMRNTRMLCRLVPQLNSTGHDDAPRGVKQPRRVTRVDKAVGGRARKV